MTQKIKQISEQKILPLTNDVVMQMYFTREGNIEQLKQFIKAVTHLTDDDLTKVEVKNPKLTKVNVGDKDFNVDVNVTTNTGDRINIEMQVKNHPGFIERMVSYNARNYSSQLERGEDYVQLREAISIVIVNFSMFDDTDEFYEHILFRRKNEKVFTTAQQFIIIDLTKISETPSDAKEHWASLFKAKSKEELDMLSQGNDEISSAADKLADLSADEDARYWAEMRHRGKMLRKTLENVAREEGREEGREEERAKAVNEKLEIAKNLLAKGISNEDVADITDLDLESVLELVKD